MKKNLSETYRNWRLASEEMLEDGYTGSLDCGEQKVYGNILTNRDSIEANGYVLTQTAAGKLVRSEPFKERVYRINGVDCIEMDSQSTASGSNLHFFALEDIERNEQGWYIKAKKPARYLWLSWHKNKPEIPMRDYSVGENEQPYQK